MTAADFPRTLVTRSMGTISVLETMLVPTLQHGNAAQDAPRLAVMRSRA